MKRTEHFNAATAEELYGLNRWGHGYLGAGSDGHLQVYPDRDPEKAIDVQAAVDELARRGFGTPVLLRFPQLLAGQVTSLATAFARARKEFDYPAGFHPVFPIKVNQHRAVVEALLKAGWDHALGLEVGSLPEMLAATSLALPPQALTICNGYKDANYLDAAVLATRLGRQVVVVLEKSFEVDAYLDLSRREKIMPKAGIRIRLQARGSGLWEKSGGVASKFGLGTAQLLDAIEELRRAGQDQNLVLLHFHIGSQVTEIRRIKQAVREAARIYAKVVGMGVALQYLDVGGGLGVDYDGSRTSSDASMNYTVQEYANDVIYTVKDVCDQEEVPPPRLICESGRMLTAYHSILVTDVRAAVKGFGGGTPPEIEDEESQEILDMGETAAGITVKNYREFYHDALEYRDRLVSAFELGLLTLRQRARGEELFWTIVRQAVHYSRAAKFRGEEFMDLEKKLHEKYVCNFSVFQSLPDHFSLDQLFPIVPVHRLNERPKLRASLADITCDSEGEVEKFVHPREEKEALEVHDLHPGEPYRMAFLLVGAYQDALGDLHNLFGRVHEADVVLDANGAAGIREIRPGESAGDTLTAFGFTRDILREGLQSALARQVDAGKLDRGQAEELLAAYSRRLETYTYLS
jgi:arginine decarboxylase